MKLASKLSISIAILFFSSFLSLIGCSSTEVETSSSIPVTIVLKSLKANKLSEDSGDEVFFNITKYSNQTDAEDFRVPSYPNHWLSKHLHKVKDVTLWKSKIQEKETIELILSLVEHDLPIWDLDDHLGSIKVFIENSNGQLITSWHPVHFKDGEHIQVKQVEGASAFDFTSESSSYYIDFDVLNS